MKQISPNATRYTSVGLVAVGLILIYLAWNGAAGPDNGVDLRAQFPYLLSGGIGGLALVATGLTLVRVFESRRDTLTLVDHLNRLTTAVERLEAAQAARDLASANGREELQGAGGALPPPQAPPFEAAR